MGRRKRGVAVNKTADSEQIKKLYIEKDTLTIRNDFHRKYSVNTYGWHKWVFDQYSFGKNAKILELGCGTGNTWMGRDDKIPPDAKIILTDLSPLMSGKAIENLEKNPQFTFQLADIQKIPFTSNEFDIVIANHMLYHVPNLKKAISEISRVLKKDGVFYSTTIGENSYRELTDIYQKFEERAKFSYSKDIKFNLKNGEAVLKNYFSSIEKRLYIDSLAVTDANDLMEYITSSNDIPDDVYNEIKEIAETEIRLNGVFKINKEQGMFICIK